MVNSTWDVIFFDAEYNEVYRTQISAGTARLRFEILSMMIKNFVEHSENSRRPNGPTSNAKYLTLEVERD